MAERLTLTSPVAITDYTILSVILDWRHSSIKISVQSNSGEVLAHAYFGNTAETLIRQLNTTDFSVMSLHKRVLERLALDGILPAGTVTGTPDTP
jgi:phosphopentomutase